MRATARTATQQRSRARYQPPPLKGWVSGDLTSLKPDEAHILDNWYPSSDGVTVRNGYVNHKTGLPIVASSLLPYNFGNKNLFAVADGKIYDVTSAGAVGSALVTGLGSDVYQHVNFGTSGGNFLIAVNGTDAEKIYNGSAWADMTLTGTGYGAGLFANVTTYQSRLFFIPKNELAFYYLPIDSISGTVTKFNLSRIAGKGGEIVAADTWSRDGGTGLDDYIVFITSEGQVIVYQGIDPSISTGWLLVGVYEVAPPIGRRCLFKLGGELILITVDGYIPLSAALPMARAKDMSISDNIKEAVKSRARLYKTQEGWEGHLYASGGYVLFNVPVGVSGAYEQHVMNIKNMAWTRFTGINARCWCVFDERIFFTSGSIIYEYDIGFSDAGAAISAKLAMAFNAYGTPSSRKLFNQFRPYLSSRGVITINYTVDLDYGSGAMLSSYQYLASGTPWGSPWGSPWATASGNVFRGWLPLFGEGNVGSLRIETAINGAGLEWRGADILMTEGSVW
jgi:hypothetical protein